MAMIWNVGLDLGGEGVRMAVRKSGVVFAQSALAAYRPGKKEYVALGDDATPLLGREPEGVRTGVMLESGRVSREALLDMWLPFLFDEAREHSPGRPVILYVGSPNAREADLQAVRAAAMRAGALDVSVLEAEMAAALGAWYPQDAGTERGAQVDVTEGAGTMVVDVGAYGCFAALIAGGKILRRESLPFGMRMARMDLSRAIRTEYGLAIGDSTAEDVFRALGGVDAGRDTPPYTCAGLHLETLLPAAALVRAQTVRDVLKPYADAVCRLAASIILHAPAELCADIDARGALLTGGGARLPMIKEAIERASGARCRVSAEPELASIRGAMRVMSSPNRFGELPLNVAQ